MITTKTGAATPRISPMGNRQATFISLAMSLVNADRGAPAAMTLE